MTNKYETCPKGELHKDIDELRSQVKGGKLDAQQTIERVQEITDEYVAVVGDKPDTVALDRMATLILDEELSNPKKNKMSTSEFPLLSDDQEAYRKAFELPEVWSQEVGSDGRDYRPQTRDTNRKMREVKRHKLSDKRARSRNRERKRKYNAFIRTQPVYTYYLPPSPSPSPSSTSSET